MILLFVLLEFICFIGNGSSEFGVEIENTIYVVDGDNFTIKCPEGTVHSDWTLNLVSLQLSASILDYTVDVKYIMGGLVVCFILVVKLLCVCFNIVNVNRYTFSLHHLTLQIHSDKLLLFEHEYTRVRCNKSQTKSQTQLSHLISQVESLNRLHMSQQALHENLSQQAIQSNLPPISPTIMHQLNAGNMNQKDVVQSLQTQIQNELASQQMILQQQNLMQAMQANVNAEEPSSNDNDLKPTASKNIKKSPSIPKMLTPHMQIVIGD